MMSARPEYFRRHYGGYFGRSASGALRGAVDYDTDASLRAPTAIERTPRYYNRMRHFRMFRWLGPRSSNGESS